MRPPVTHNIVSCAGREASSIIAAASRRSRSSSRLCMIRGSECQRIEASYKRHALRLAAALSSVDCDQEEDGDQNGEDDATGILSTPVKKKKDESRNEDVVEIAGGERCCEYERTHDEEKRVTGMNDVDDVAEDSRGDARGSSATNYKKTKTTKTTITFLVYAPTAVRST